MKKCKIESCSDCPNFDNIYYSWESTCELLERVIEDCYSIPEDCPLKDWDDGDLDWDEFGEEE